MVANSGGDVDHEGEVEDSWDTLEEAPVQAEKDDLLRGDCNLEDEVVQDSNGDAFQIPRCLPEPKAPSREAVRRHNMTHWPYASWCPHCVMARRSGDPHFQNKSKDSRSLPLLVLD